MCTLLLVISFNSANAQASPPSQAFAQLADKLSAIQSLETSFVQTTIDENGQPIQVIKGDLVLEKPLRFFWHTQNPQPQTIVSNGDILWVYDPDLEQVIIHNANQQIANTPIRLLSGEVETLKANYQIERASIDGVERFFLKPQQGQEEFEQIVFEFFENSLVKVSLNDSIGQRTVIDFVTPVINPKISDNTFEFTIPPDIDVIDERKQRVAQ